MEKLSIIGKITSFSLVLILIVFVITSTTCKNVNDTPSISKNTLENDVNNQKQEGQTSTTTASEGDSTSKELINNEIIIGVEYVFPGFADDFTETGIEAVKPFPEAIMWEKMQKSADSAIDFSVTDRFVKEYQKAGFENILLALRSRSNWASKDYIYKNLLSDLISIKHK